jgi:uncharacterized membrane protein
MDELPPDALEKKIRIGCGALAGVALGASIGIAFLGLKAGAFWVFVGVAALAFALLAVRYGDRFWLGLMEALRGITWW